VFVPDVRMDEIPLARLENEIVALAVELSTKLERWLRLVDEFDRRGAARELGFRGTAEWLAWRCELGDRAAREHVRVARGLRARPRTRAAFAAGELSYSKVRALTRAPAGEDEAGLLALARDCTAGELDRTVRALRNAPSADEDVAARAHARRFVSWWWEPDGSLSFRGRLSPEDGAVLIDAVETAACALYPPAPPLPAIAAEHAHDGDATVDDLEQPGDMPAGGPGPPPLGARRADAVAEIMRSGAPRAQVVLHVDSAALTCTATGDEPRAGEVCHIEHGPAIPSITARRLACDAEVMPAIPRPDGTLDHGRKRRVVSPALRSALQRRDQCCRFPGCDRRHDLHAHHVTHWAHGGPTDSENLILLCRFHHRAVHEDGFTVRRVGPGDYRFHRPDGEPIFTVPGRAPKVPDRRPIAA
jgi:hypothetical protein